MIHFSTGFGRGFLLVDIGLPLVINDFIAAQGLVRNGMGFGNISEMGKVKSLERQGRAISTEARPLPKPVMDWIMSEADKYAKKEWAKNKGGTYNI